MAEKVLYEKRGEVAYITLNRPEVKNAIDIESHELLCDMWRDFRDDPGLRVAVITGTGDAFCAGSPDRCRASPSPSSPRSTAGASARRRAGDGMRHPDRL
jgi:enoyl-CoA hydratase/carnithine racemase